LPSEPHQAAKAPAALEEGGEAIPRPHQPPLWHQFRLLTARYLELIWSDRRSLRLLLLQAPIVAVFVLLGFLNKPYQQKILVPRQLTDTERDGLKTLEPILRKRAPNSKAAELVHGIIETQGPVVPDKVMVDPRFTYMLLYMLVITILWLGCNNAAKEIVKEEAIYGRERAVNLGILPYLASKFLVLTLISALQVLMVMVVIFGTLEVLHHGFGFEAPPLLYRLAYVPQYLVLVLLAVTGVALGLLLSACVSTTDRANTLLPYVLIPQIILGGGIMPIREGLLLVVAQICSPAYWAYRAVRRGATLLPSDLPAHMDYNDSAWLASAALGVQILVLLLLTAWFLRRKDVNKA
ncbi:MAG: ABC transporter permease, partial [Planctomycetes bacterium]|nr:ABC transporter permease [Planctomycetota bacterium]